MEETQSGHSPEFPEPDVDGAGQTEDPEEEPVTDSEETRHHLGAEEGEADQAAGDPRAGGQGHHGARPSPQPGVAGQW